MGRQPYKNQNLPPRMRARKRASRKGGTTYYYYDTGEKPRREILLGKDYLTALQAYTQLEINTKESAANAALFEDLHNRYLVEVIPGKARRTQEVNLHYLKPLKEFFKGAPLKQIKPQHIAKYLQWRNKTPVAANREITLFGDMWRCAAEWGWVDAPNPAATVRRHKEKARDRYIEDAEYIMVWNAADAVTRNAMDLAYLTGQRKGDLLALQESQIRDGAIWFRQEKTSNKLRVEIKDALADLIDTIHAYKRDNHIISPYLLVTESGEPLTNYLLRFRFHRALKAAKVDFTFHDIRAKTATDKAAQTSDEKAQQHLGHASADQTRAYIRNRLGHLVEPMPAALRKES